MKKIILLTGLFLGSFAYSQMVVTDIGATTQLSQQVAASVSSLKQLQDTYKVMKDAQKTLEQVNTFVAKAGYVENIINKQKEAIYTANQLLKLSKNRKVNTRNVTQTLQKISGSIKTTKALLTSGIFNMNDNERLQRLESEYTKVSAYEASLKATIIQSSFR